MTMKSQKDETFTVLLRKAKRRFMEPTWQEESVPGYNPLTADTGTPRIPIKVAYFLCQTGV